MRVFACELVTGGGLTRAPLPARLCRDGDIMLRALVADLADAPGITVVTTRDRRLPDPGLRAQVHWIDGASDPWAAWETLVADADAAWPIAPETDGALAHFTALSASRGCVLLGSRVEAVRVAASKRATAERLATHGVPVAPTAPLVDALAGALPRSAAGWVVKPDDGAGAADTFRLRTPADVRRWSAARPDRERFVIQPYLPGDATSLSLLCRDGRAALLACNSQDVRLERERFHYDGGVVGAREHRRDDYAPLAARIAAALPHLWGHAGVDLVDTPAGPVVLEVNARLTVSYAGLRDALGVNPAALALDLLDLSAPLPSIRPRRACAIALDAHVA